MGDTSTQAADDKRLDMVRSGIGSNPISGDKQATKGGGNEET